MTLSGKQISVLIVSSAGKGTEFLQSLLTGSYHPVKAVTSAGEARRLLISASYDIVIVNTPLSDEFGDDFAADTAFSGCSGVILLVGSDLFDTVGFKVERAGVIPVAKPLSRQVFYAGLQLACAVHYRLIAMEAENRKLKSMLEDQKIITRAKLLLITELGYSEEQAHKYIEKEAMDSRLSRREVAENIISSYKY